MPKPLKGGLLLYQAGVRLREQAISLEHEAAESKRPWREIRQARELRAEAEACINVSQGKAV
jgi:hypothetical protein